MNTITDDPSVKPTGMMISTWYQWYLNRRDMSLTAPKLPKPPVPQHLFDALERLRIDRGETFATQVVAEVLLWKSQEHSTTRISSSEGTARAVIERWWIDFKVL